MKNLVTQREYDAALARGRAELETPHATCARFVGRGRLLEVTFSNGISFSIDPRMAPNLQGHSLAALQNPRVTHGGDGIVFEGADLALKLSSLLAPFVPIDIARSRVASATGSISSPKKASAARENGAKGGRPRKNASTA